MDEHVIRSLREQGACVDIYGVGDAIAVSKSHPCFGGVYKIVELDDKPLIKLSEDIIKISNPGFKEVYRIYDEENFAYADLITLVNNDEDKEKLLAKQDLILRDEKYEFKFLKLEANKYTYKKLLHKLVDKGNINEELYGMINNVMKSQAYYFESLKTIRDERKRLENPHKYYVDLSLDLIKIKYNLIKSIKENIL